MDGGMLNWINERCICSVPQSPISDEVKVITLKTSMAKLAMMERNHERKDVDGLMKRDEPGADGTLLPLLSFFLIMMRK